MPHQDAATPLGRQLGDTDDLFGKLDQLISRHQGRTPRDAPRRSVPMLTEPVDDRRPQQPEIPVLEDVVESRRAAGAATGCAPAPLAVEKRRQLQVALYLRLRQRLDQELEAALAGNRAWRRLGRRSRHARSSRGSCATRCRPSCASRSSRSSAASPGRTTRTLEL